MKPVALAKDIYWVGAIDWKLRNFHGYLTQRGSTYNAYLIVDEKITLIDTVKSYLCGEMLARISRVVDVADIDYIIANHVEMDHSGSLPELLKRAPNAKVLASPKGVEGLRKHYGDLTIEAVKTNDSLNVGSRTLQFVQTPMVHWPDNMYTYLPKEKILFSNDSFGQHIASPERFDDEVPNHLIMHEAQKYYANIVMPYGGQVQRALKQAETLDIRMIAPSHGLIWRSRIPEITKEYQAWSSNQSQNKAVIIYDTMWGSTEQMALAVYEAFMEQDIPAYLFNLKTDHISDIITHVLTAGYICVGSPTLNNQMLPTAAAFLTYLRGLAPKNRIAMAFGSYGWGGQSVKHIHDVLADCGFAMLPSIKHQYVPSQETLAGMRRQLSERLKNEKGENNDQGQV